MCYAPSPDNEGFIKTLQKEVKEFMENIEDVIKLLNF